MRIIKRLFGRHRKDGIPAEASPEDRDSGPAHKIFPRLQPGGWEGPRPGTMRQILLGTKEAPRLVLGFGYDLPGSFTFIALHDLQMDLSEVVRQANENIEKHSVGTLLSSGGRILTVASTGFSSEKILGKTFMAGVHQKLGSAELLASLPRRGFLMFTPRRSDALLTFVGIHESVCADEDLGEELVTGGLLLVENGEIKEMVTDWSRL